MPAGKPALRIRLNALTFQPFRVICGSDERTCRINSRLGTAHAARRGGVCRRADFGRLLLVQFIVALLAAGAVVWFLDDGCFPTVTRRHPKIAGQPAKSAPADWTGTAVRRNCSPRAISWRSTWTWITPAKSIRPPTCKSNSAGKPSASFRCSAIWNWHYPPDYVIAFNRTDLEPLWGAWATEILIMAGAAVTVGLLLSWWLLATVYFLPVWLLGFFANRDLNFRQSWRLAGAALMPGALLMAAAIVLYGIGFLNLVSFGFIFGAHFVIGWIYLFVSLLFVPRASNQLRSQGQSVPADRETDANELHALR